MVFFYPVLPKTYLLNHEKIYIRKNFMNLVSMLLSS